MSRSKKSRKNGAQDNAPIIVTRNRTEADVEGRLRKRLNKRKGLKSGNRHSAGSEKNKQHLGGGNKDPRHGSKKPIPLVVDQKVKPKLTEEQELEAIQNDGQLNALLDRLDNGEKLGAGLQSYVDEKLDRLEVLMKALGIETDYDDEEIDEDDTSLKESAKKERSKKESKTAGDSDDDLLSKFEHSDLNDWK